MSDVKIFIFRIIKDFIPQARSYIVSEKENVLKDCHEKYLQQRQYIGVIPTLPLKGTDEKEIKERVEKFVGKSKKNYQDGGNMTGGVYTKDTNHWQFISDIMKTTIVSNPLHLDEF